MGRYTREWSPVIGGELVENIYSGSCKTPYRTPIREDRVPGPDGFVRMVDDPQHIDKLGSAWTIPDRVPVPGEVYYVSEHVPCGKCPDCINYRKWSYEVAAAGWFLGTDVTVLVTLTFGDDWFKRRGLKDREKVIADMVQWFLDDPQKLAIHSEIERKRPVSSHYNPKSDRDFRDARSWLSDDITAHVKRLRQALKRRPEFSGATLAARFEVLELGGRHGRLHAHNLWHFSSCPPRFAPALKRWVRSDWQFKRGIGFIAFRTVKDVAGARYSQKYLGKFEEHHGKKIYVGSNNRLHQSNSYGRKGRALFKALTSPSDAEVA